MKVITFTTAAGYPGVTWPSYDSMLPDESEDDFLARVKASAVPVGASDVQIIDEASYVAPPLITSAARPTPREWLERLSADKQAAITSAAMGNASLMLWLFKAMGSSFIDVTAAETIEGVGALVTAGVLTTADQTTMLAP